jgi:DNA-binding NarL/FixJ family response regulator
MAMQHNVMVQKNISGHKKQCSIALVEDEKDLREAMLAVLRHDDVIAWTPYEFASAESALQALSADVATGKRLVPDMMIMDVHFVGGMSGIECLQRLQVHQIEIPTLIVSADSKYPIVFDALRAGALGYIHKPLEVNKFLEYIHECLEGGSPMSQHIARMVVQHFKVYAPKTPNTKQTEISARELEVLTLMAKNLSVSEIAGTLAIAELTVRKHCQNIYRKLHVSTRQEAIATYASRDGIFESIEE